ncbi:hypothetical protein M413DRAFT_23506 [Hebeloma cylindrosporum]|uniref:Uncharacterized protein n=1 Tax=Hebeloma cylindrosporum TaxID=76867 RepID=A0A0C3CET1_HEBCY|nr:hypothetical protein M413DRAFT_23506 [Hebeloma cylindrosporum h7]
MSPLCLVVGDLISDAILSSPAISFKTPRAPVEFFDIFASADRTQLDLWMHFELSCEDHGSPIQFDIRASRNRHISPISGLTKNKEPLSRHRQQYAPAIPI